MHKLFFLCFFGLYINFLNAQDRIIIKYPNGQIKLEGFVKKEVLEDEFIEYFANGKIKRKGTFKNCDYETNSIKIHRLDCEFGAYLKDSINIRYGKRHGEWIYFDSIGNIESKTNYYCDLKQGSDIYFYPNGQKKFVSHYFQDKEISSQEYSELGVLLLTSNYFYNYSDSLNRDLIKTIETKFYENGNLRSVRTIDELENSTEIEVLKEYYTNGFLKTESEITNNNLNGIHSEYFENGHLKSQGKYLDDKPIEKHYYYKETGELQRIEEWKDGKFVKTEYNNKAVDNMNFVKKQFFFFSRNIYFLTKYAMCKINS